MKRYAVFSSRKLAMRFPLTQGNGLNTQRETKYASQASCDDGVFAIATPSVSFKHQRGRGLQGGNHFCISDGNAKVSTCVFSFLAFLFLKKEKRKGVFSKTKSLCDFFARLSSQYLYHSSSSFLLRTISIYCCFEMRTLLGFWPSGGLTMPRCSISSISLAARPYPSESLL